MKPWNKLVIWQFFQLFSLAGLVIAAIDSRLDRFVFQTICLFLFTWWYQDAAKLKVEVTIKDKQHD